MTEKLKGAFVALGTFDGLHLGHRAVITSEESPYERKIALMFSEHPQKALSGINPGKLMTPNKEKEILNSWGIEPEYISFKEIYNLTPQEFVDDILIKKYNAKSVACGFNYRFGKDASGDTRLLSQLCSEREIKLTVVNKVEYKNLPISSTRIRQALLDGNMQDANKMLGRYFSYDFKVQHGDERGRVLGSPTINQFFTSDFQVPQYGVYASFTDVSGKLYPSVTNIGVRPTIGNSEKRSETHIIGFEGDLYGKNPQVYLVEKTRGEMQFDSLKELGDQIKKDRENSLRILEGAKINGI